jgi:hypothetical protein
MKHLALLGGFPGIPRNLLTLTDYSVRFVRGAWSNGGFTMAEFRAILAAPFSGKYFHLMDYRAMEDSLWQSFVLLLLRLFPVSIFILWGMEQLRIHYDRVSRYSLAAPFPVSIVVIRVKALYIFRVCF